MEELKKYFIKLIEMEKYDVLNYTFKSLENDLRLLKSDSIKKILEEVHSK